MTGDRVRVKVKARLPLWVEYLTHGYFPSRGEVAPSGAPSSRPPAPCWVFDLGIAFSNLSPLTRNAPRGDLAWVAHQPFNEQQHVVWLYYGTIPGVDTPLNLGRARQTFWAHEREREEREALSKWQRLRDADVARHLRLSTRRAYDLRREAIYALAADLNRTWGNEDVH